MNHLNRPDDAVMRAQALRPAIDAAVEDIERTKRIPEPLLAELHRSRLLRMLLPRSAGGDELEPWTYLRAIEEVGRADASIAWNMFVATSSALIASFLEPEAARAIFGDPRTVIAWGPPNACQAKAVP